MNVIAVVVPPPTGCTSNCGGGGGGGSTGGGGGGAVIIQTPSLKISNEKVNQGSLSGTAVVEWTTNLPSDSRVVYGTSSVSAFPSGDEKYGYPKTTVTVSPLVTTHSVAIGGIDPNLTYYFRPVSRTSSLSATGIELTLSQNGCYYLRGFMKLGDVNNDPIEVKKLQVFLNEFEGAKLDVSGIYDIKTRDAVDAFQNKYKLDVLDPWGHKAPTGYVYLTTRKQVNEIYCKAAFPLDGAQSAEVNAFRALLESLRQQGIATPTNEETATNVFTPTTGLVKGATDAMNSLLDGENTKELGVATNTQSNSITNRGAVRNMIAGVYGSVRGIIVNYWFALVLIAILLLTGFYAIKMAREERLAEEEFEAEIDADDEEEE